jgi:hypothetical protein
MADDASIPIAAVREDAATLGFQSVKAALFPDSAACRGIEGGEGAVPSQRSLPTWLTAARRVARDPVEMRSLILRVFLPFVCAKLTDELASIKPPAKPAMREATSRPSCRRSARPPQPASSDIGSAAGDCSEGSAHPTAP